MKDFEYVAPVTAEEALSLLSQYKEEAKIIAGGQSMLVVMRQGLLAPEVVVDVKGITALDYMTYDEFVYVCTVLLDDSCMSHTSVVLSHHTLSHPVNKFGLA